MVLQATYSVEPQAVSIRFSKAQSPVTCRSSSQQNSNWSCEGARPHRSPTLLARVDEVIE
jgi:hypothetical protein